MIKIVTKREIPVKSLSTYQFISVNCENVIQSKVYGHTHSDLTRKATTWHNLRRLLLIMKKLKFSKKNRQNLGNLLNVDGGASKL